MLGRNHQICQGVNVDPGTAAQFRLIWKSEAELSAARIGTDMAGKLFDPHRVLILKNRQNPGDVLVMTAAIYSLHRQHPGRYLTAVDAPYPEIFANNPDVISLEDAEAMNAEPVEMHYPAINQANVRGIHFMQAWCEFLGCALGVDVPLLTNRPHVYLAEHERKRHKGKYWLISCGGKKDLTAKFWGQSRYQEVVDCLRGKVIFMQVGASTDEHSPLMGVVNLIGATSLRELIVLASQADGVLCGVTFLQHLAAALQKPSIVILGGREPQTWNTYPKQHLMHAIGMLPCCEAGGCWKSRVVPLGDGKPEDSSLCERPTRGIWGEAMPECMTLISPDEVVAKIIRYCS